jgi:hypothetical protein
MELQAILVMADVEVSKEFHYDVSHDFSDCSMKLRQYYIPAIDEEPAFKSLL